MKRLLPVLFSFLLLLLSSTDGVAIQQELDLSKLKETAHCSGCQLQGANRRGDNLQATNIIDANLQRAFFNGSILKCTNFQDYQKSDCDGGVSSVGENDG